KVGPIKIPKYPICKHVCRLVSVSSFYVTFFFASSPAAIRHPPSAIRLSEFIQRRSVSGIFIPSSMSSSKSETEPPILSLALPSGTGRVLSIQSHTVQGYVGNKSAVFPLQLLGYDVDPINSVQFSNHTGKLLWCYPSFKGQVLNGQQLWELIEGLEANNLLFYTHLLTGYIGSVSFLNTVLEVVNKLRTINPKLTYVCDPVMGDEGKLYVPVDLVAVYREKVVPVASMLTPNQFEAEQLTGSRIVSESDGRSACNKLHAAGPSKVVLTSINIGGGLLLIGSDQKEKGQPPQQFKIAIPKIPAYFTLTYLDIHFQGTGDLMTALLLGWSNKYPDNLDKAAELAVSSLQALLQRTVIDYQKAGYDPAASSLEIRLIQSQDDIRNPNVQFKAEKYS
ncbi:Pyridoxal kinase, partial [Linum grandiflorum]